MVLSSHRNGYKLIPLTSIYEMASLVPAAAVIPALKMHRTIAAVKQLVAGSAPALRSIARCALVAARVLKTGVSLECSCME
jgi:hypothetical protein